jgi:hypothetical protein
MSVTVQVRRDFPPKTYHFDDPKQGNMFAYMCRRDGDYLVTVTAKAVQP